MAEEVVPPLCLSPQEDDPSGIPFHTCKYRTASTVPQVVFAFLAPAWAREEKKKSVSSINGVLQHLQRLIRQERCRKRRIEKHAHPSSPNKYAHPSSHHRLWLPIVETPRCLRNITQIWTRWTQTNHQSGHRKGRCSQRFADTVRPSMHWRTSGTLLLPPRDTSFSLAVAMRPFECGIWRRASVCKRWRRFTQAM